MAARARRHCRGAGPCARASTGPWPAAFVSFRSGTFGGGGGGGVPRRFSRIHLPRSTGEVRWGYAVTARMLPWPSSPRRLSSVSVTRRKWLPLHVGDPVVPGQPFVDERVVGASAAPGRCGPRAGCCRRTARSHAAAPAAGSRRNPGTHSRIRMTRRQIAEEQPLAGEVARQRLRTRGPPASAAPAARAPPDPGACRVRRRPAARRPGCCSREKTTDARPTPGR